MCREKGEGGRKGDEEKKRQGENERKREREKV